MKNLFLSVLVLSLLTLSVFAQPSTGPYPTPVTGQQIAAAGGVTNGAPATVEKEAQNFLNSAGISSISAQNNVNWAVKRLKARACFNNCIEYIVLDKLYNPTNHIPLIGNSWTCYGSSNELYSTWGQDFFNTNILAVTNLSITAPCTIAITVRSFPADVCNGILDSKMGMVSLMSQTDGSSLLLSASGIFSGRMACSSAGTTWYIGAPPNNPNTNTCYQLMSGAWDSGIRNCSDFSTTYCISYNTNGTISTWRNGMPCLFLQNANNQTNLLAEQIATSAFTQLSIGGNTNWLAQQTGTIHTNFQGQVLAVGLWNQSCEQNTNIPIAAWQAAMCMEPYATKLVQFAGSSRLNFDNTWYYFSGIPATNDMPLIVQKLEPTWVVINDSYPGSFMTNWFAGVKQSQSSGIATNYAFTSPLIYTPWEKFPNGAWFVTDGPRNDEFLMLNSSYCLGMINSYCLPLVNAGINVQLIETGIAYNEPYNINAALWSMWSTLETNFPFAKISDERSLTMDILTNSGVSGDWVHVGSTNTISGYNGALQFARIITDGRKYSPFFAAQPFTVSGSPWYHTNSYPYTVHDFIFGGTISGIGKNGVGIYPGSVTSARVDLAPGDIVMVTNSVAPTFIEESTQY